jgi:hypothetical protein
MICGPFPSLIGDLDSDAPLQVDAFFSLAGPADSVADHRPAAASFWKATLFGFVEYEKRVFVSKERHFSQTFF